MFWGCCPETTQVVSDLYPLCSVVLSFLNNHFHFIPDEIFWEMRRMLMRPEYMECMSLLCKDCLSLQIMLLK